MKKFLPISVILIACIFTYSIVYHFYINDSDKWAIVSAYGTLFTWMSVLFLMYQIKVSQDISNADFVIKLDDVFNSKEMIKKRKRVACLDFSKSNRKMGDCLEVLDFFEKIAYFEKEGVLSLEVIDEMWGFWIKRYWALCEDYVRYYRTKTDDASYYMRTESLFEKAVLHGEKITRIVNQKNRFRKERNEFTEFKKRIKEGAELKEFLDEEKALR
jgi:hypothetical protein